MNATQIPKSELLKDKQVYVNLKSEFSPFAQTLNNLAKFKGNEKKSNNFTRRLY